MMEPVLLRVLAGCGAAIGLLLLLGRSIRAHYMLERDVRETLGTLDATDALTIAGKYRILRLLGSGGMARVYLARALSSGLKVALKIPDHHLFASEGHRSYFSQELSTSTKMRHPNIVQILDYGDGANGALPYIAMEYVRGTTLDKRLVKGRPSPVAWAAEVLWGVMTALEYAHQMGAVHRDIKPENIILRRDGEVKVMDFGVARDLWDKPGDKEDSETFVGSPYYMSPEQINSDQVDYRADYYALGVLAFKMLTGRMPFEGDTTFEIITRKVAEDAPLVSSFNPKVPVELDQLVRDLMAREPERRPASPVNILKILRKYGPASRRSFRAGVSE